MEPGTGRVEGTSPRDLPDPSAFEPRTGERFSLGPGLRCWVSENAGPLTLDGTRTYLVGRRRLLVVDPGPDLEGRADRLAAALRDEPVEVEAVCLTHAHPDHAGCAEEAAERLGAPVAAGAETLARLGLRGRTVEDGDELSVDGGETRLLALSTPGHSRDHFGYLWLPIRWLFTGDLVLGAGSSVVAHPDGSVGASLASLARLAALRPARLLPGHGPPVEEAVAHLEAYRRHRLEREAQVLEAVRAGASSLEAIRARVYGELPAPLGRIADRSVVAHLAHLREGGHELPDPLRAALAAAGPKGGTGEGVRP